MPVPRNTCDAERLRLLLADQLPEPLQAEVAEHVAECTNCRQALESFAGDAGWWSEVESCFRANAEPACRSSGASSSGSSSLGEVRSSDESFAADFVVDFLEPCDQSEGLGRLGEYEILEVIGRGGMGVVLKGFQRELGRYVAVKVVAPHLAASGAARKRFVREARAAAAIVHPHVMAIHSVDASARLPFLVMPYVACESLQQRLDRSGPLELKAILRIASQTAAGLQAAHAQGLIHRDVKPANILLEKGVDRVMLTDFGLARAADDASVTRTGVIAGTPQFMSPEQARGEALDQRTDLFSLGSAMYAMCTGRPPFRAETSYGILRRITDVEPRPIREVNPDIPEWLAAIVAKLHAKNPVERYQSADEVARLLEGCLAHVQQPTVIPLPVSLAHSDTTPQSRHRVRRTVLTCVAAGVVLLAAAAVWQYAIRTGNHHAATSDGVPNPAASASDEGSALDDDTTGVSDDAMTREAEKLESDIAEFEQRSKRLWDDLDASGRAASSEQPQTPNEKDAKP